MATTSTGRVSIARYPSPAEPPRPSATSWERGSRSRRRSFAPCSGFATSRSRATASGRCAARRRGGFAAPSSSTIRDGSARPSRSASPTSCRLASSKATWSSTSPEAGGTWPRRLSRRPAARPPPRIRRRRRDRREPPRHPRRRAGRDRARIQAEAGARTASVGGREPLCP